LRRLPHLGSHNGCFTRDRRRITDRARQHAERIIIDRGDVVARTSKTSLAAFRGASTEHAE
jgi:hypothetical protein